MPSPFAEWLQSVGVIHLTEDAVRMAGTYGDAWLQERGTSDADGGYHSAFLELAAAEFALGRQFFYALSDDGRSLSRASIFPLESFPVAVGPLDTAIAMMKTDCGPFAEHSRRPLEEIRPWDVFVFSGDMSKAELWDITQLLPDYEALVRLSEHLAERYRDVGLHESMEESGLLAAQGLVWATRLALLRGDDVEVVGSRTPFVSQFLTRRQADG